MIVCSNVETVERVPHIDHYRNVMSIEGAIGRASRPTLAQLHEETADLDTPADTMAIGQNTHEVCKAPTVVGAKGNAVAGAPNKIMGRRVLSELIKPI